MRLRHPRRPRHKELLNIWLGGSRFASNCVAVDRRVAPAKQLQALFLRDPFEHSLALETTVLLHRQKTHGHAISARLGQLHAKIDAHLRKKRMGNLDQDSRAVARLRVAACRTAMGEVDEHLKTLADDVVALLAANARDQTHAAVVVLVLRVVKSLCFRDRATLIESVHGSLLDEGFNGCVPSRVRVDTHPVRFPRRNRSAYFMKRVLSHCGRVWDLADCINTIEKFTIWV